MNKSLIIAPRQIPMWGLGLFWIILTVGGLFIGSTRVRGVSLFESGIRQDSLLVTIGGVVLVSTVLTWLLGWLRKHRLVVDDTCIRYEKPFFRWTYTQRAKFAEISEMYYREVMSGLITALGVRLRSGGKIIFDFEGYDTKDIAQVIAKVPARRVTSYDEWKALFV